MKKILFFMATLCCLFLLVPNTTQAATTKYKTGYINNKNKIKIYTKPSKKSSVIKKVSHGAEIKYKKYNKKWYVVKMRNKKIGYIQQKYISNIKMAKQTSMQYTWNYFRYMGVINWGNWTWTWYSQRVLPGGGLNIPGRHVNQNGYVCDGGNYICLASSVLSRGTIVNTPFGSQGKIYDSGCSSHILDVYVNW